MNLHQDPPALLSHLLRPAGGGLYLVSTGRAEQLEMQRRLYGVVSEQAVQDAFMERLARIRTARAVVLAIPSDVGAGYRRGANLAPAAMRTELLAEHPDWPAVAERAGIVDIGDVFVVPQLLHDDMLSAEQLESTRRAIYPHVSTEERAHLPVSPLSIAERALDAVFAINPHVVPFVLGGDHSCAWPVVRALARVSTGEWGIVQPDAHTDLLEERLGIRYCFATWSYHANLLLGRGGRLVQVGTRASRRPREYWEAQLGVRQFWADECRAAPERALSAIVSHLRSTGVRGVYFSNDIDGTDAEDADATGTPEPNGLRPDFVVALIRKLGEEIGIIGGDVMEVAPLLASHPEGPKHTVALSVRYLLETMNAALRVRLY